MLALQAVIVISTTPCVMHDRVGQPRGARDRYGLCVLMCANSEYGPATVKGVTPAR